MPVAGRKAKPEGQRRNRHAPTHEWTEVVEVPHEGGPDLPDRMPDGQPWPARTRKWWDVVRRMPHAALWTESDWGFAEDCAVVAAKFHAGDVRVATELRNREKVLGTTADFRRDLRIRYVKPGDVRAEPQSPGKVAELDAYRAAVG